MIFLEKKGRFGNFLFQFFLAKYFQKITKSGIIVFSTNENIYNFNSKNNIDKLIKDYISFPKFSKFLNLWKKKCLYITDYNFKYFLENKFFFKKNIYLDGFFQNISMIENNIEILDEIIDKKKLIYKNDFTVTDLTIHIRHLYYNLGTLDTSLYYQDQPDIEYYSKIIEALKPKKIKVICSNEKNENYLKLKNKFNKKIILETKNDIVDFFNLIYSKNIILSNSTFALWGALFSRAENIYVPMLGNLKKIFNKKNVNLNGNYIIS
jgi:hypothetical protein